MIMLNKTGLGFNLIIICLVAAALTIAFLGFVSHTAKERVARQYAPPDYVRYLSQGYTFDAVSNKYNILVTVTDGSLPIRVHLFTIDENRHTLDVLELPPNSKISVDGFSGTLRDAFETPVYKDIVSRMLCLKINGSVSFSAETFGNICELLELKITLPQGVNPARPDRTCFGINSKSGERTALDGFSYSHCDTDAVKMYRRVLAGMLNEIYKKGPVESFSLLMNLMVNRVDTDMTINDMIAAAGKARGIKPAKMRIYIAPGSPADDSEGWMIYPKATAELLNQSFRVYGSECPASSLGVPDTSEKEFIYADLESEVSVIIEQADLTTIEPAW